MPAVCVHDVPSHFPCERGALAQHRRPYEDISRWRHDRTASESAHLIEQNAAGLDVGHDRGPRLHAQSLQGKKQQQLVGPHDAARGIDYTNTISVAIEGNPEIRLTLEHCGLQLLQVLRDGRVRMMRGEATIDLRVEQRVPPRQARRERTDNGTHGAITAVPYDMPIAGVPAELAESPDVAMSATGTVYLQRVHPTSRAPHGRRIQQPP